ncbi:type IV secretory system conjugative DNA transfer family protein [Risungbinella massiliensis]|uniref:hypothetical protein n=1 Tax=Risungbinella massiliensis TaxID=1329796 RepID=UPI0005CB8296|nr:hypothetical protein [Risungbinella massiliensis]
MFGSGWDNEKGGESFETIGKIAGPIVLIGGAYGLAKGGWQWLDKWSIFQKEVETATVNVGNAVIDFTQAGIALGACAAVGYGTTRLVKFILEPELEAIQVSPSLSEEIDPSKVWRFIESLGMYKNNMFTLRRWFSWRIVKDKDGKISFYLIVPRKLVSSIQEEMKLAYPGAVLQHIENLEIPFYQQGVGKVGHMMLGNKNPAFGLNTEFNNEIANIVHLMEPETILDIRFSASSSEEIREEGRSMILRIRSKKDKLSEDRKDEALITERYRGRSAFDVSISLWSRRNISGIATKLSQRTKGMNYLELHEYSWFPELRSLFTHESNMGKFLPTFVGPLPWRRFQLTDKELAQFTLVPPVGHPAREHIELILPKLKPAAHLFQEGLQIGYVDHPEFLKTTDEQVDWDKSRPLRLDLTTLDRHGVIPGATGAGKGGFIGAIGDGMLEGWAKDTMPTGFTLCDPHMSSNLLIINKLLALEEKGIKVDWDRVRCYSFNPKNEHPTPLNILAGTESDTIDALVKESSQIITEAFPGELTKSRELLEAALHALLWDSEKRTIAEIPRLFRDDVYIEKAIANIQNPVMKEYFVQEVQEAKEQGKNQNLSALITRIFPFISQQIMQRSFCQYDNVIDGERIIEKGEIVLLDFNDAPPEMYKLTAGWLVNHYLKTAIRRKPYNGKHHYLILDEAQEFRIETMAKIVQQTRKFHLGLWLLTQDTNELDPRVKKALETNYGFFLSLRQNQGVEQSIKLMNNEFKPEEIKMLPDNHGVLRTVEGSANIAYPPPAFIWQGERTKQGSKEADKAYDAAEQKFFELVKRDCRHYSEVDQDIARMMNEQQRKLQVVRGGGLALPD